MDELSEEPETRPSADPIEYNVRESGTDFESLDDYHGELPIIATSGVADSITEDSPTTDLDVLHPVMTQDSVEAELIDYDIIRGNGQGAD